MKAAALVLALGLVQPAAEPSLETLLDRLTAYLLEYERTISEVLADEQMMQIDRRQFVNTEGRRKLKSEVGFMRLPGDGEWIGYRLVYEVNGRAVSDQRNRLHALLTGTTDDRARGMGIARESARHNMGLPRTTNVPLLAFELVHPRHRRRFAFSRHGLERVGGRQLRRIDFVETASPTVIQTSSGLDLPSRGSVWMEEQSGRVFQTEVRDRDARGWTRLMVTFVEHRGLGLLVPDRMREVFAIGGGTGDGEARYTNFRRFTTSARIVPQR